MTSALMFFYCLYQALMIYLAISAARSTQDAGHYINGNRDMPAWAFMFAGAGIMAGSVGIYDSMTMFARFGLQYNHVMVSILCAGFIAVLMMKRLWLAARIMSARTLGDILAVYYGSLTIRLLSLIVLLFFVFPLSAITLAKLGAVFSVMTDGMFSQQVVVWSVAFFLFLAIAIGGWRGGIMIAASNALMMLLLLLLVSGVSYLSFDGYGNLKQMFDTSDSIRSLTGVSIDTLPGVVQFTRGIGKSLVMDGVWTSLAVASFGLALIGIVAQPGFCYLAINQRNLRGFAFQQVWLTGGVTIACLLILLPIVSGGMMSANLIASGQLTDLGMFMVLAEKFLRFDAMVAAAFVLLVLISLQLVVMFSVLSGANIFVDEIIQRYVLPDLTERGRRLGARVTLAVVLFLVALWANIGPEYAYVLNSVTFSLSAQFVPAIIGLCWIPWIARPGVLAGLVLGIIMVIFTEPLGIILFEQMFIDLPWGRWPWTIHSAGWGLFINVLTCLIISGFRHRDSDHENRHRLHDVFRSEYPADAGGRRVVTAIWSLTFIWMFFAIGPGAVIGNDFFVYPIFTGERSLIDIPSIWAWQMLGWLIGVLLLWWVAYGAKTAVGDIRQIHKLTFDNTFDGSGNPMQNQDAPSWIVRFLNRFVARK